MPTKTSPSPSQKNVKSVRFPVLFCFFITSIFYEIIPITKKLIYPWDKYTPIFLSLPEPVQEIVIFICFFSLSRIFFFKLNLRKIIIAITIHVTSTYNPSDQKETKFRFYYDKMTHPFKPNQNFPKRDQKNSK